MRQVLTHHVERKQLALGVLVIQRRCHQPDLPVARARLARLISRRLRIFLIAVEEAVLALVKTPPRTCIGGRHVLPALHEQRLVMLGVVEGLVHQG